MDSILTSVKLANGITEECVDFDDILIMHINSVLTLNLCQLGVGPEEGFTISDSSAKWSDFVSVKNLEAVKTYVGLKVKLLFDQTLNSSVVDSINRMIAEYEWRLNLAAESKEEGVIQNGE